MGLLFLTGWHACQKHAIAVQPPPFGAPYERLSEYHFFRGAPADLNPNDGVLPYEVINALFTDYAFKSRFVWMPAGVSGTMKTDGTIEFPSGTILIKVFYYPEDMRHAEGPRRIMETRLLIHEENHWSAYAYIWNERQSEAIYSPVGDLLPASWVDSSGLKQSIHYLVPNKNQCKNCHNQDETIQPIGPKYANLNRTLAYTDGSRENQLTRWIRQGYLNVDLDTAAMETMPLWSDPSAGSLQARALAYLDVNCGHCHRPNGPGNTSGLYLQFSEVNATHLGICKVPVAAGKGSGGRRFDIHPGHPDASILMYRVESTDPGVMMPELGRSMVHREGVALIRNWIASLDQDCYD